MNSPRINDTVMIIDDEPGNLDVLGAMLGQAGWTVQAFPRGDLAITAARAAQPDLVLLDVRMPVMDGYQVCRCFKQDERLKGIPIIFLSAFSGAADILAGFDCGGCDYITKPFIEKELIARVSLQLQLRAYQVRLEELVRERTGSLRKMTQAIEQSPVGVMITDLEGAIEYVNPALARDYGYEGGELLGQNPRILKSGKTDPHVYAQLWEALRAGREWRGELCNHTKSGKVVFEWNTLSPLRDDKGLISHYVAIKENITQKKRADEERRQLAVQLMHARRMETLGQLAGGMAHDFNHQIQCILGFTEIQLRLAAEGSELHQDLAGIKHSCLMSRELIRQLLAFSRSQVLVPAEVDINRLVEGVARMIQRVVGPGILLIHDLFPSIPLVSADPAQIEQVIVNLIMNARDAMSDQRGEIVIATRNDYFSAHDKDPEGEINPGGYVCLSVSDTGSGIAPEVMTRIFEPFFTTKEEGKGVGLGLATVYGIVKQHGGFIRVFSQEGKGTTFRVFLPILEADSDRPIPMSKHTALSQSGCGDPIYAGYSGCATAR
jgi:PAS domain S-box-containing protein